jgi:hypothetical protein
MPRGERGIVHFVCRKETKFLTASLWRGFFFERVIRREKKGRPEKAAGIDETLVPLSSVLHLASLGQ